MVCDGRERKLGLHRECYALAILDQGQFAKTVPCISMKAPVARVYVSMALWIQSIQQQLQLLCLGVILVLGSRLEDQKRKYLRNTLISAR